jgi:hypothetical protein
MATNGHEKSPLQSKKFIAYLAFTLSMKMLYGFTLAWMWSLDEMGTRPFLLLLIEVVIDGFVTVGYILGQAGLDRFVRLAQIATDAAGNGNGNGMISNVVAKGTKGMVSMEPPRQPQQPRPPRGRGEPSPS